MVRKIKPGVGVVAFGEYIPEIFRGDVDEDVNSFCLNVVMNIKERFAEVDLSKLGAVYAGSESFPYAVKPVVSLISQQLGIDDLAGANMEFACKAGTAALRAAVMEVVGGGSKYALAIGADISQARSGDVLEETVGAGAGGVVIGRKNVIADVLWMGSVATDTPDFWRRAGQVFPEHAGRFTGVPSYFRVMGMMIDRLLEASKMEPGGFDFVVLHSPNMKFPDAVANRYGFAESGLVHRELFPVVKNAYAGSSMLGLSRALAKAKPGDKVLVASYGSGAGSDGFILQRK